MKPFSIYLVDDHKLFREGLGMLLKPLPFVSEIVESGNGEEFLRQIEMHKPGMVFMDINMPVMNGMEATSRALNKYPDLAIVALSMFAEEEYYRKMIEAGVRGFMLKNSSIQDVEECIRTVISGHNYFSPEILDGILKSISRREEPVRKSELTGREEEVLYRICQGYSNQEIAEQLNLSKRTVDKHRENLLLKTGSKNTAGLVMFAIRCGIVEV